MKKILSLCAVLSALLLWSCANNGELLQADYQVVPLPNEITAGQGDAFVLKRNTKILYPQGNMKMERNAEFLSDFLSISTGKKLGTSSATANSNAIILSLGLQSDNPEAYRLTVDANCIKIEGASEAGVFYGIQTLRKATPVANKVGVQYAPVVINDAPRFGYRGMHLDIARHFQSVDFVKKYIDMLALHNMNTFHWHLTDDQGWRIEIKKYPKLTEVGSKRPGTVIGRNTGEFDSTPVEGYYTQDEIRDVVKYAAERYINVIPEVDLPGHMLAALAAYPELGCTGGPYEVEKTWGVFDDVLCAGNDTVFTFLEDVFTEVMDMFPYKYVHIGGDECPKTRWETCPKCQARIKELSLKDKDGHTAEHYLQSYVTARIEQFLNKHGRSIIGWDEILEGELAPNATVMSWRGSEGGIKAAQMGHDVIMTPNTHLYFDYYQSADTDNEPFGIGGFLPLKQVYSLEPTDKLTPEQAKHILGAQANLWTEYIKTEDHAEYMVLPRAAALAEVQWTQPNLKNYDKFLSRLPRLLDIYKSLDLNFAKHIYDVDASLTPNFQTNALDVTFSTLDNAPIYYTLDGSEPTTASTKYEGPFALKQDATVKAKAIRGNDNDSRLFSEVVKVSKSSFRPIELLTSPAPNYAYTGASLLVDGLKGVGTNYKTGRWIGFSGTDLVAVIDLQADTEVSEVEVTNCVVTGDWIFDASQIAVDASLDGKMWKRIATQPIADEHTDHWQELVTHNVAFDKLTSRYFRITIKPTRMPQWHPGKGNYAFIFVDEIAIR